MMTTESKSLNHNKLSRASKLQDAASPAGKEQKEFPFVTYTGPIIRNPEIQKLIRRHVMVPIAKERKAKLLSSKSLQVLPNRTIHPSSEFSKRPDIQNDDLEKKHSLLAFKLRRQDDIYGQESDDPDYPTIHHSGRAHFKPCPEPRSTISSFFAGRSDPFIQYPVEMTPRLQRILDHVFDDSTGNMKPYRDSHFPLALLDAAAFHQILSTFIIYMPYMGPNQGPEEYEANEALYHQAKAIRLINKRISIRKYAVSEGMIAAVIGLVCHANIIGDFEACCLHMDGLAKIIALRGGFHTLKTNKAIQVALGWLDINISINQDHRTHWPLCPAFTPVPFPPSVRIPPALHRLTQTLNTLYPNEQTYQLTLIIQSLSKFFQLLNLETQRTSGRIYHEHLFAGSCINPLAHRLLNMQAPVVIDDSGLAILQACRLGILLSLAEIRRKFGIYPVECAVQIRKLRGLFEVGMDWMGLDNLEIWVLSMAVLEGAGEREWFLREWMERIAERGYRGVEDVEEMLRELPWMNEVHGVKLRLAMSPSLP